MGLDWASLRTQYPVAERCVYLNTGWAGPSSREVVRVMQERAEREAFDGPTSPDVRHEKAELVQRVKGAVARLIGADDDELALLYTTTEGINTVVRGVGLRAGDEILVSNLEHNAIMVPAYVARQRDGVGVNIVRFRMTENAQDVLDVIAGAMTDRTRLLLISHVAWNRGTRLPMREICEIAHARGTLVAVDAAQSAGHVAFDVKEMGCDFLALPAHKWLLGPAGAAFLYARRGHVERLQPLAVVHGASRRYDFQGQFEYANDTMRKFELTTHSGPVLAGLEVALWEAAAIGIDEIDGRCTALASTFMEALDDIGGVRVASHRAPELRSGIVTFEVEGRNPSETCAALWALDRIVARVCNDRRVRVCFHMFNDERDVERTVAAVRSIADRGLPASTPSEAEYKEYLLEGLD